MEDVDTQEHNEYDDEAMFLSEVIQEEHELLFLDSYLREAFKGRGVRTGAGNTGHEGIFGPENTI